MSFEIKMKIKMKGGVVNVKVKVNESLNFENYVHVNVRRSRAARR